MHTCFQALTADIKSWLSGYLGNETSSEIKVPEPNSKNIDARSNLIYLHLFFNCAISLAVAKKW